MRISRRTLLSLTLVPGLLIGAARADRGFEYNVYDHHPRGAVGEVYTMSNAVDGNEVLAFSRDARGRLGPPEAYETGGLGTGSGLGNQGGVVLNRSGRWLFVVNAGSDQISVFRVRRRGLALVDVTDSGGSQPVSVAVDRNLLYVLNAGSDSITGFHLTRHGHLAPVAGSTRPLSTTGTGPAQISFSPDGQQLVVTEKATSRIVVYQLDDDGLPSDPIVHDSVGQTPFGFAFDRRGRVFVSEAAGGAPDASSVSSYELEDNGDLETISGAVPTTESAACWVVVTGNGRFAYTTNAASGSISGYFIDRDGSLSLLDADGRTGETGTGSGPIDMSLSVNSRYLYTLNGGNGTISAFRVGHDGSLNPLSGVDGLPPAANGLAAR
jgi:6-phosphogluconolactonase (cycloisomerase 2 family)